MNRWLKIMLTIQSPTLIKWLNRLKDGLFSEGQFWDDVKQLGTPLVEDIGIENHVLVTFLWSGSEDTKTVVVSGFLDGGPAYTPCENQMTRIENTKIWVKEYVIHTDARFAYHLVPNDPIILNNPIDRKTCLRVDPYNPLIYQRYLDEPPASVVHLPNAPEYPWLMEDDSALKGKIEKHGIKSSLLNNTRDIWIYTPPNYDETKTYPSIFFTDGDLCTSSLMNAPNTLNNLINAGKIPPIIAVMISPIDRKRRFQELTCNDSFVKFLVDECLPWVRKNWPISDKPEDTIISGISLGGLNALYVGMSFPTFFGKVLSQSGSFWWAPEDDPELEWLTRKLVQRAEKNLTVYMEAGLFEDFREFNLLQANRHLRDVLMALGNTVYYSEFSGGHDDQSWPGTLGYGLIALLN
jgi:enterochelin esterase-like enzyme